LERITEKFCTKCRIKKLLEEFYIRKKHSRDGLRSQCKKCIRIQKKAAHQKVNNREKEREYSRRWSSNNKEKVKERSARSYVKNKEKINERSKKWKIKNYDKRRESRRQQNKNITPKSKLNINISSGIRKSLKGNKKNYHWENLVGYTINDLKNHLGKSFLLGMTWENYGLWHIDHEIPISAFNFEKPEHLDFKKCWGLKNLRPMWAKENLSKYNKLDRPFQPSLKM